jgi:hypothetical protein
MRNNFHNFHLQLHTTGADKYAWPEIKYQNGHAAAPVKSSDCGKICGTFAPFSN